MHTDAYLAETLRKIPEAEIKIFKTFNWKSRFQ